ncbi:LPXTG cell wall anchor domain-containing protein [bacterium]|nr:MAG: LPXTG cell wall anchor domain-containing protein [bacterium]
MNKLNRPIAVTIAVMFFNLQIGSTVFIPTRLVAQEKSKDNKPVVAVLDLQVSGGILKSEAAALSDRLRSEMQELKKFDLIERSQMDALLKEQDFSISELSESNAAKAGKLLSAEQVAIGTIGKVGRTYTVDVRLIEVETGKVINSSKQDYIGPTEGLVQVMRNIARIFAGLEPMKIKLESNTIWWVLGGLAIGGGAGAFLLLKKKESGTASFASPPALP